MYEPIGKTTNLWQSGKTVPLKYPFGRLPVGYEETVQHAKLGTAHVMLSRFRQDCLRMGYPPDKLPSFRLTAHGLNVIVERLPDGTQLPRGRRGPTADILPGESPAQLRRRLAIQRGADPAQLRAQAAFDAWEWAFWAARQHGETLMPSRDLLDALKASCPAEYVRAIELSSTPLQMLGIDEQDAVESFVSQAVRASIRKGDNPHDEAFLQSLRDATHSHQLEWRRRRATDGQA